MNLKSFRLPLLSCTLFISVAMAAGSTIERAMEADKAGKHKKALQLYKKAAEEGDLKAMTAVGFKYYSGEGTRQDYCAAYDWFNKAREGDADALYNIGIMFRDGQCVGKNRKIAYLSFLIIHMEGMGSEQTRRQANRNLRREVAELAQAEVQEALCYTHPYYRQVIGSGGKNTGVLAQHLPSKENLRFKEVAWWLPHEAAAMNFECPEPWNEIKAAKTGSRDGPAGAAPADSGAEQTPALPKKKK